MKGKAWLLLAAGFGQACTTHVELGERSLQPPVTTVQTTWLGNSAVGRRRDEWMPRALSHLHALPDGTVVAMGLEKEHAADFSTTRLLRDGRIVGTLLDTPGGETGAAVTGDANFLYAAVLTTRAGVAPGGIKVHTVRRYRHDGRPSPFVGGVGDGSFLPSGGENAIITVAADANELYVARGTGPTQISVYSLPSLMLQRMFDLPLATAIAIDANASLWIADDDSGASVGHYDKQGRELPGRRSGFSEVMALAVDRKGALLIADGGRKQQVVVQEISGAQRTLGIGGGISASGGRDLRSDRFMGLNAVTSDDDGNIIVGMNMARTHLARVVSLDSLGDPGWELSALASQDTATIDAEGDDAQIVSRYARFTVQGGAMRLAGWTFDWLRFPNDPRTLGASAVASVLRINGRRLLVDNDGSSVSLFRFDEQGETAIPAATLASHKIPELPQPGPWLWTDNNGDGQRNASEVRALDGVAPVSAWIDEVGTLWTASDKGGIEGLPLQQLKPNGVPVFATDQRSRRPVPPEVKIFGKLVVSAKEDAAFLSGYTAETPNPLPGLEWQSIGTDLLRYDNWSGHPTLAWRTRIYFEGVERQPRGFAVAGERVFIVFGNTGQTRVLDIQTGKDIGRLDAGQEVGGISENGRAAMPVSAKRRRNGEYVLVFSDAFRSANAVVRLPSDWRDDSAQP